MRLTTILDEDGETIPAPGQDVPQHTKDCFGCGGKGFIHAGIHLDTGRDLLTACDVHTFRPSRETMDDEFDGVLVAWCESLDGDPELLAVTGDAAVGRKVLSKYCDTRMYRCSLADAETTQWVVLTRPGEATEHLALSAWSFMPATPDTTGAVHITRIGTVGKHA